MAGTLSPVHARQRAAYDRVGVGISKKKEHVREPCVTRMGAEIDGIEGILSAPCDKMLEVGWLAIWILSRPVVSPRMLMVVLGRFTRCFEFRRPLMGLLNSVWPKSMWCRPRKLGAKQVEELIKAASLLPLACTLLRTPISGLVTCSDASERGGGMCASSGLTPTGSRFLERLDSGVDEAQCFKPQGSMPNNVVTGPRILVVSLFDGVGSLMCALGRLPCTVRGYASSEIDKDCLRLTRTRWPGIVELGSVETITAKVIEQLAGSIGYRVDFILLAAGCPGHELSTTTSGSPEAGASLFFQIPRIRDLLKASFQVPVEMLVESLFPMTPESLNIISRTLELKPYLVDAKYFSWMQRPRLFWVTWAEAAAETEHLIDRGAYFDWVFEASREDKQSWVDPGCCWKAPENTLLPTCSSPTPRSRPPSFPAGVESASDEAQARWAEDSYKLPVSNYEAEHMITMNGGLLRTLTLAEREKLMGFDDNYVSEGIHPKFKGVSREIRGSQMIGCAFCVFSLMVLLDELLFTRGGKRRRMHENFFARGVAPPSWTKLPAFVKQSQPDAEVSGLVTHFLRIAEKGGTDVRLDIGVPFRAKAWPRSGIQSHLFQWAIVHGYSWRHEAHINALELQAVLNSVKWRVRRASNCCHRALVLIDSQVVCAIIAKGRTSSSKLQRSLRSLNAICLASGLFLTVAYVDTGNNPADIPSRWSEQSECLSGPTSR